MDGQDAGQGLIWKDQRGGRQKREIREGIWGGTKKCIILTISIVFNCQINKFINFYLYAGT